MSTTLTSTKAPVSQLDVPVDKSTIIHDDVVALTLPPSAHPNRIPKGRNVSGRSWKVRAQKRASSLTKTTRNNSTKSFAERQALKRARQETLALQAEMAETRRAAAVAKKERRLENEKRRAENEYKNIQKSVQKLNVDKVGTTLKTLSKKQLRQVKKTRLNPKTGVVEFESPYAK